MKKAALTQRPRTGDVCGNPAALDKQGAGIRVWDHFLVSRYGLVPGFIRGAADYASGAAARERLGDPACMFASGNIVCISLRGGSVGISASESPMDGSHVERVVEALGEEEEALD